jgi:hypothetical protein
VEVQSGISSVKSNIYFCLHIDNIDMTSMKTKVCPKNKSYEECELISAENTAKLALEIKGKSETSSDLFRQLKRICIEFISKTKTVVYGGTAINELLPKEDQFYNPEVDIPDYDIYSPTPITHAKQIVDIFIREGFEHVEAKSALHFGTYKVFVNFVGALDITFMPKKLFQVVQQKSLTRRGILYANPDLLRQAMYVELSNPIGDVERWKKVLPRLHKLNKVFPIKAATRCNLNTPKKGKKSGMNENVKRLLEETMISEGVVFLGGFANSYYLPELSPSLKTEHSGYYDIIVENPLPFMNKLTTILNKEGVLNITKKKHAAVGELVGPYYELEVDNSTVLNIFEPTRCYAYNEVDSKEKKVRIASFDTLLSFYFAFLYADLPHFNKKRIMCMANVLFDVMHNNIHKKKGVLERFPLSCYGKHESVRTMRSHKWKLRQRLKKGTLAYNRWFFKYSPFIPSASPSP